MLARPADQSPILGLLVAIRRVSRTGLRLWAERAGNIFLRACVAASLRGGVDSPVDPREVELLLSYYYQVEPSGGPFDERLARALVSR